MKATFTSIALFVAGAFAQSSFTMNTPSNVVECQPTLLSWTGGTAPYSLSILPGNAPSGAPLQSFPQTNSTSLTWVCNIASGTSIGFTLHDATGAIGQSAPVTINAGSSSDCLNTTSTSSGPTAASSSPATSTSGATTAGTSASTGTTAASSASASASSPATSTGGATTAGASTGTKAASSASASSSAPVSSGTSGASANVAQFGAVAVVGAAVAALFL